MNPRGEAVKSTVKFLRLFLAGFRRDDPERSLVIRPNAVIKIEPPLMITYTRGAKVTTTIPDPRYTVTFRQPGSRERGYGHATADDLLAAGITLPLAARSALAPWESREGR
jgi:hypothetical protein